MNRLLYFLMALSAFYLGAQDPNRTLRPQQATVQPSAQEARVALVIGNGAYNEAPLRNPVNDAQAMKEALESCKFTVRLLTNAPKREMEEAIAAFGRRLRGGAVGLFYFAGHGIQVKGANYLIPVGARLEKETDVTYEGVDVGKVLDEMEAAKNALNLLILDACRNNPFARSWRSADKGLAQVSAPTGSLIAYATAPGRTAADGTGEHGAYTEALLAELREPGQKAEDLFKRVRVRVTQATGDQQVPWESSSLKGDFYFRPQRSAEEIAREQAALQAETQRLEEALRAQQAQAQTAEAARQAELLKARLRAQELERQRLAQEEARRQDLEAEARRLETEEARRQEEAARLEALKRRIAGQQGQAGTGGASSLEAARAEVARLVQKREALLMPIKEQQQQALSKLEASYNAMRQRLEAPRDEFETSVQFQERLDQAKALKARLAKEREGVQFQYAELAKANANPLDTEISSLRARSFAQSCQVKLGVYDPDQGQFEVLLQASEGINYTANLPLEPSRARELKSRQELLKGEGHITLAAGIGAPQNVIDPLWGALALRDVKALPSVIAIGGTFIELIPIPAGSFRMGTLGNVGDELAHNVTISRGFWMGKFPVKQGQWRAVMWNNPSAFKDAGLNAPVESVSWDDVQQFLAKLNGMQEQFTFRLPTESEWEYSCRAGTEGERYGNLDAVAWYDQNSRKTTHPVGLKQPNAFGLYDMLGNGWQWCQDWFFNGYYSNSTTSDPTGPTTGQTRVARGGSWLDSAVAVRPASRNDYTPGYRNDHLGFRVVVVPRTQ